VLIVNQDPRRELTIIGVVPCLHHCTRFGGKLVQLGRLDPVLDLGTDTLCDQIRVHMLKTACESLDSTKDLIERHGFVSSVAFYDVQMLAH
jgi:hypothetical protein